MKSAAALILATTVAAEYGYGAPPTSSKLGYTTIYPGHGKAPVTVTAQYQPIPTYVDGKWSHYEAISSVITDAYGKKITVTATDECVTVYHTKKTITHTITAPAEGYAKPTGYYGPGNATYTTRKWHELYEEIHEVPYKNIGPHAIPGYSGNPKYRGHKDEQDVRIKKYSGGKWHTLKHTYTYNAPKPSVTTYDAPGTYTVPAKDITVDYPTTVAVEKTYHAQANKPCTYGGQTTDIPKVTKPTTITAPYVAYETHGAKTKTVIRTKTITVTKPGKYIIAKPTTTVYAHDTEITYPSVTKYDAGVYHHPAETVTITKAHQAYTCKFEQTSKYPVPTAYGRPSSVPSDPQYPTYPTSEPYPTYEPYPTSEPYPTNEPYPTSEPYPTNEPYPTYEPSSTKPYGPDPSSDYGEPSESYGHASAGYVKRGGVLERRKAEPASPKAAANHVILV